MTTDADDQYNAALNFGDCLTSAITLSAHGQLLVGGSGLTDLEGVTVEAASRFRGGASPLREGCSMFVLVECGYKIVKSPIGS